MCKKWYKTIMGKTLHLLFGGCAFIWLSRSMRALTLCLSSFINVLCNVDLHYLHINYSRNLPRKGTQMTVWWLLKCGLSFALWQPYHIHREDLYLRFQDHMGTGWFLYHSHGKNRHCNSKVWIPIMLHNDTKKWKKNTQQFTRFSFIVNSFRYLKIHGHD